MLIMSEKLHLYLGNSNVEPQTRWFVIRGNTVVARAKNAPHSLGHVGGCWAIEKDELSYSPFHEIGEYQLEDLIQRGVMKDYRVCS